MHVMIETKPSRDDFRKQDYEDGSSCTFLVQAKQSLGDDNGIFQELDLEPFLNS